MKKLNKKNVRRSATKKIVQSKFGSAKYTHEQLVRKLMRRPGVRAEVERIERGICSL